MPPRERKQTSTPLNDLDTPPVSSRQRSTLRVGQKLGKYRIEKRLADGGFAAVYRAMDTIEGIRVALKIPHAPYIDKETLHTFRKEVRLTVKLEHPGILPLKNASFIDERFVIVFPLGVEALSDRLRRRMSLQMVLNLAEQMLAAVGYAHRQRVIHCDIKPDNFIIFSSNRVRLTDFGIAKVAQRTVKASGSGTVGYIAPEQAMGKPSLRSDVFSMGLVIYRMLTGVLPEWPYRWPLLGNDKLRRRVGPEMSAVLKKALEVDSRKRYRDADQMLTAFRKAKDRALRRATTRRKRASK